MLFKPKFKVWALLISIILVLIFTLWASQAKSQYITDSIICRGGSWAILRAIRLDKQDTTTLLYTWRGMPRKSSNGLLNQYFIHNTIGWGRRGQRRHWMRVNVTL